MQETLKYYIVVNLIDVFLLESVVSLIILAHLRKTVDAVNQRNANTGLSTICSERWKLMPEYVSNENTKMFTRCLLPHKDTSSISFKYPTPSKGKKPQKKQEGINMVIKIGIFG